MTRVLSLSCVMLLLWLVGCASQQARPVVADGYFGDWPADARTVGDPVGDADGPTDLVGLSGQHAGDYLFLRMQIAAPANLQKPDDGGGLRIEVRGANDTVVVDTGERRAERNGAPVPWSEVAYVGLPTHAATEFEIRLVAPEGGLTVNVTGSDTLEQPLKLNGNARAMPPRDVVVGRDDTPLRVVTWNVLNGGPFNDPEREADGREVLHTLDADVLLLQEVWGIEDFAGRIRDLCGEDWNVHEVGGVAVASRLPLTLLKLDPPVELDERRRPRGGDSWSVMRNLFVGVDTPVGPIVVVSAHWKCCGYAGSREDMQRMDDALVALKAMWRLRDAGTPGDGRRGGNTPHKAAVPARFADAPIVIAGDFNLVGSRAPLDMLRTAGLVELVPIQSDEWSAATWRALGDERILLDGTGRADWKPGGYPQGRLDLVLADRRLNVSRTFIADLGRLSLVSDHLPIVVDIAE